MQYHKYYLKRLNKEIHDALCLDYHNVINYLEKISSNLYFIENEEIFNERKQQIHKQLIDSQIFSSI